MPPQATQVRARSLCSKSALRLSVSLHITHWPGALIRQSIESATVDALSASPSKPFFFLLLVELHTCLTTHWRRLR